MVFFPLTFKSIKSLLKGCCADIFTRLLRGYNIFSQKTFRKLYFYRKPFLSDILPQSSSSSADLLTLKTFSISFFQSKPALKKDWKSLCNFRENTFHRQPFERLVSLKDRSQCFSSTENILKDLPPKKSFSLSILKGILPMSGF